MPISGLLLTLKPSEWLQAQTFVALKSRREIEVGDLFDAWLPVAVDTASDAQSRELHDWIASLPGVEFVDVVSVHFEYSEELAHADSIFPKSSIPQEVHPCR